MLLLALLIYNPVFLNILNPDSINVVKNIFPKLTVLFSSGRLIPVPALISGFLMLFFLSVRLKQKHGVKAPWSNAFGQRFGQIFVLISR